MVGLKTSKGHLEIDKITVLYNLHSVDWVISSPKGLSSLTNTPDVNSSTSVWNKIEIGIFVNVMWKKVLPDMVQGHW